MISCCSEFIVKPEFLFFGHWRSRSEKCAIINRFCRFVV